MVGVGPHACTATNVIKKYMCVHLDIIGTSLHQLRHVQRQYKQCYQDLTISEVVTRLTSTLALIVEGFPCDLPEEAVHVVDPYYIDTYGRSSSTPMEDEIDEITRHCLLWQLDRCLQMSSCMYPLIGHTAQLIIMTGAAS